METLVRKWGNSKAIILPRELTEREPLRVGDRVEILVVGKKKISAFGIDKEARRFVRKDRLEREF